MVENGAGLIDLTFENSEPGVCYISGLSVVPEKRKNGIATKLMAMAEKYCRSNNIFRLDLNSVEEPFVMNFYHKLGFKDIKEEDGFMRMYKIL